MRVFGIVLLAIVFTQVIGLNGYALDNLCNVFGSKQEKKEICKSCFLIATPTNDQQSSANLTSSQRDCIKTLPIIFHDCVNDEQVDECLKDKIRSYFKLKFQRFWKKWKDVFNETERGRIHQVFAMKTLLHKIGLDSPNNLGLVLQSFLPCTTTQGNNSVEGRRIGMVDALDVAALEGSEDEDDIEEEEELSGRDKRESSDVDDIEDETEFIRKRQRLVLYIDAAYQGFLCKVNQIKQNEELVNIFKNTIQHSYDDVVPAEVVRTLYPQ